MTYKNTDVIKEFCNFGDDTTIKAKHLYFEGDTLFSYRKHYPLCIRLKDGWIINLDGYSHTTSTHREHLIRELTGYPSFKELVKGKKEIGDFPEIKLMDTKEMRELLDEHEDLRFITLSELNKLRIIKNL